MSFKLKPPIECDNTPVYQKDMEDGVLGMANRNGTILVSKNLSPNKMEEVIEHEKVHIDQMKRGDLDYDSGSVYWKGRKYSRKSMMEGAKNLPWEKEAYNKTKK